MDATIQHLTDETFAEYRLAKVDAEPAIAWVAGAAPAGAVTDRRAA